MENAATCGDGTFSNDYGIETAADCQTCPAGFYCSLAFSDPILDPEPCGKGRLSEWHLIRRPFRNLKA